MWLGDNPLCLDFVEFRNQHRCILPLEFYIKRIIWITEFEGFAFFAFTYLVCLLKCLFKKSACIHIWWKLFLSLAYPFSLCLCSVYFFFLQWSPNPWCEQMWKFLVIVHEWWCYCVVYVFSYCYTFFWASFGALLPL